MSPQNIGMLLMLYNTTATNIDMLPMLTNIVTKIIDTCFLYPIKLSPRYIDILPMSHNDITT